MDDAYKMDAVQCTHPRRTRGSSSNTSEGIKGTKGRFRKLSRSIRPYPQAHSRIFFPLLFLHPYCFMISSVQFLLHFSVFALSCFHSVSLSLALSLYFSLLPSDLLCLCTSGCVASSRPDRTSLETTRNCV